MFFKMKKDGPLHKMLEKNPEFVKRANKDFDKLEKLMRRLDRKDCFTYAIYRSMSRVALDAYEAGMVAGTDWVLGVNPKEEKR